MKEVRSFAFLKVAAGCGASMLTRVEEWCQLSANDIMTRLNTITLPCNSALFGFGGGGLSGCGC
ncbi:hypothetical protein [Vibrio ponticus]|uniref:hypothetical protein n=1 Tax=Vibrio ponticus TaxID=265668 RepID=UPI001115318D|nr:hypothetical protein [Vibrio ponticus]